MGVFHKFVSAKADGIDVNEWQPSQWNAAHTAPPVVLTLSGHPSTYDAWVVPAAETEYSGGSGRRIRYTTRYATRARITVAHLSSTLAIKIRAQSSTNQTTWVALDGASGPSITLTATDEVKVSAWVTLATASKADDLTFRLVGLDGDGVANVAFGMITLQFD